MRVWHAEIESTVSSVGGHYPSPQEIDNNLSSLPSSSENVLATSLTLYHLSLFI